MSQSSTQLKNIFQEKSDSPFIVLHSKGSLPNWISEVTNFPNLTGMFIFLSFEPPRKTPESTKVKWYARETWAVWLSNRDGLETWSIIISECSWWIFAIYRWCLRFLKFNSLFLSLVLNSFAGVSSFERWLATNTQQPHLLGAETHPLRNSCH